MALLSAGCRSSRTALKEELHGEAAIVDSTRKDSAALVLRMQTLETVTGERVLAHLRITELSEPDSTGRQHPVRVTDMGYSREGETGVRTSAAEEAGSMSSHRSLKKSNTETARRRETIAVRHRPLPWRLCLLAVLLGLALMAYYRRRGK